MRKIIKIIEKLSIDCPLVQEKHPHNPFFKYVY